MILDVSVGETWEMRRPHPCGSYRWRVYRVGADIGIECLSCGRRVMVDRRRFENRAKRRIESLDG